MLVTLRFSSRHEISSYSGSSLIYGLVSSSNACTYESKRAQRRARANDRGSKYTLFFLPTILPVISVYAWEEGVGTVWAGVNQNEEKEEASGRRRNEKRERKKEIEEGKKKMDEWL